MANVITVIRVICSIALLLCQFPSPAFYILYVTAGITDIIDGAVARKTDTVILLFILPLTLRTLDLQYTGAAVCTVTAFAAVQEGYYIRTRKV